MNAPTLAKIMCQVQGNDHYDSDYAPCSECRELASAILAKEATQPEKLGLIGRDAVLIEQLAKKHPPVGADGPRTHSAARDA